ncbi:hypothetical protein BH23DEI1_BH23DEI1_07050 [soil metagenome]|nr:DUF4388 domain-containing protein [Trueperaceae bacterium]
MATAPDALLIVTMQHRRAVLDKALTRAGWSLTVYDEVGAALLHVRERPYSAIFCDEYLRGASAGGFLAWSRRLNPDVPFYVIAMQGDEAALGVQGRPDRVMSFPPIAADLPRPAKASLWDGPPVALRDLPLEGTTALVPLGDLIEMLALTSASAVITLGEGRIGRVYLTDGQIEHAVYVEEATDVVGIRGLGRLLDLPETPFQVLPYRHPSRRTLHVSTAAALTEAARVIDEQRRDGRLLEAVITACPDALGVATGYLLNDAPTRTQGDGVAAFARGVALVEAVKATVSGVTHLCVEAESHAFAIVVYRDGQVLAAHAPRGRSLMLLSSLAKAVKTHTR